MFLEPENEAPLIELFAQTTQNADFLLELPRDAAETHVLGEKGGIAHLLGLGLGAEISLVNPPSRGTSRSRSGFCRMRRCRFSEPKPRATGLDPKANYKT
jgi:hypothetical protein